MHVIAIATQVQLLKIFLVKWNPSIVIEGFLVLIESAVPIVLPLNILFVRRSIHLVETLIAWILQFWSLLLVAAHQWTIVHYKLVAFLLFFLRFGFLLLKLHLNLMDLRPNLLLAWVVLQSSDELSVNFAALNMILLLTFKNRLVVWFYSRACSQAINALILVERELWQILWNLLILTCVFSYYIPKVSGVCWSYRILMVIQYVLVAILIHSLNSTILDPLNILVS